ncbi:Placenta-expressed transcript 1 protein [Pteropus alecto]|uniref:Placenta-expressed transcript 1 protein n=1 Tax=Pteropus alecto TaxID=9402 RepID=L5KJV2_PTEAL|nr:Placenta-expressed transcript 1 protein [Pteropus alecto]
MAVLGSALLPRGLFLCLGMLFISAISANYTGNSANYTDSSVNYTESSANYINSSMSTTKIVPITPPKIQVHPDVYESNTVYTVLIPVATDITTVALRALDINNNLIGFWHEANRYSEQGVVYNVMKPYNTFFKAEWESPNSTNITTVEIQAFSFHLKTLTTFSHVKMNKRAMTTMSPYKTTMSPYKTSRSLGNRIFLSPIEDAIQIMLVFLISKLLLF